VDSWLAGIRDEDFVEVLPLLRRTFGTFAPPERRSIGSRAAVLGPAGHVRVVAEDNDLDEELAASVLPAVARLLGV
jgi:hypothetical protein